MKFSVILVARNEEKTIEKCLSCVKANIKQRKDVEIIVIDDNSDDQTANISKSLNIRTISLNQNLGIAHGRNLGIKESSGEYLLFLDAHTYLKDKNIFDILEKWLDNDKNVVGVSGRYQTLKKQDLNNLRDIIRDTYRYKKAKLLDITFDKFTTFSPCVGAMRRAALETQLFPEEYKNSANEDSLVQLVLMNKGFRFVHVGDIQAWHDASLNTTGLINKLRSQARGFANLLKSISRLNLAEIPYSPVLYDFPIAWLILLIGLPIVSITKNGGYFYGIFFFLFLVDNFHLIKILKKETYSSSMRYKAIIYAMLDEAVKIPYFFYYLVRGKYSFKQLIYILKLFAKWETKKIKIFFNL